MRVRHKRDSNEITAKFRADCQSYYRNKYYNLYMNRYKIPELSYQENDFIFRKFWADGCVASFKAEVNKVMLKNEAHPNGVLCFAPFIASKFNIYDFPISVLLTNTRGSKFIPTKEMIIDQDVVIGYTQRNKKSIKEIVEFYVDKIVSVEMTIRTNLKAQKNPVIIGTSPENAESKKWFYENLDDDNPYIFLNIEDVEKSKALVSGAPYNIDKLYSLKCSYENELREFFGFQNLGVNEKAEHLINSEVASNNAIVKFSGYCLTDMVQDFVDRINEVFNENLTLEVKDEEIETIEEVTDVTEENDEDEKE